MGMIKLWLKIFPALLILQQLQCNGVLKIEIKSFKNPSHETHDRTCCVTGTSNCRYQCSNILTILVTHAGISYPNVTTRKFDDDTDFSSGKIGEHVDNPIKFPFKGWKNQFHFTGIVTHKGNFRTGTVASFSEELRVSAGVKGTWTSKTFSQGMRRSNKKHLSIEISVTCDTGYLLPDCVIERCMPRDDNLGHYTCNSNNGKVCLQGWKDPKSNCLQSNRSVSIKSFTKSIAPSTYLSTNIPTSSTSGVASPGVASRSKVTSFVPLSSSFSQTSRMSTISPSSINKTKVQIVSSPRISSSVTSFSTSINTVTSNVHDEKTTQLSFVYAITSTTTTRDILPRISTAVSSSTTHVISHSLDSSSTSSKMKLLETSLRKRNSIRTSSNLELKGTSTLSMSPAESKTSITELYESSPRISSSVTSSSTSINTITSSIHDEKKTQISFVDAITSTTMTGDLLPRTSTAVSSTTVHLISHSLHLSSTPLKMKLLETSLRKRNNIRTSSNLELKGTSTLSMSPTESKTLLTEMTFTSSSASSIHHLSSEVLNKGTPTAPGKSQQKGATVTQISISVTAGVLIVLVIIALLFLVYRSRKKRKIHSFTTSEEQIVARKSSGEAQVIDLQIVSKKETELVT